MSQIKGDFTTQSKYRYAVASALTSTNWVTFADMVASGTTTFSAFKDRLNSFDLESRLYIVQKLTEQKPNITGATRRIRLNSFINSVKNFKPTGTPGPVETSEMHYDSGKPFWQTDIGQFLVSLSGVNTNPTGGTGGTLNQVINNSNNNTNDDLWKPDTNVNLPPKKNNTVWWIVGGVLVTGVVISGVVIGVRAVRKRGGKK